MLTEEDKQRRVDPELKGKQSELPEPGRYVKTIQGIYSTNEPIVYGEPIIRDGCCGAALVRVAASAGKDAEGATSRQHSSRSQTSHKDHLSIPGKGLTPHPVAKITAPKVEQELLHNGEIGGFMHWANLQEKTADEHPARLYCYAETADLLVENGWRMAWHSSAMSSLYSKKIRISHLNRKNYDNISIIVL